MSSKGSQVVPQKNSDPEGDKHEQRWQPDSAEQTLEQPFYEENILCSGLCPRMVWGGRNLTPAEPEPWTSAGWVRSVWNPKHLEQDFPSACFHAPVGPLCFQSLFFLPLVQGASAGADAAFHPGQPGSALDKNTSCFNQISVWYYSLISCSSNC